MKRRRAQKTIPVEGVYLMQTEDGLMAKRLKLKANGDLQVTSDNPDFNSWTISTRDAGHNLVIGKVIWCARSI